MMRRIGWILIFSLWGLVGFASSDLKGLWQGVLIQDGKKESEAVVCYLKLEISDGQLSGMSREEAYSKDLYVVQRLKGQSAGNQVEFKQQVILSKKSSSRQLWCSAEFKGQYIDSTGYLEGRYISTTCKRTAGRFILYRSDAKFSENEQAVMGHAWRDELLADLKAGRKAPEIRELERKNFKFQAVYFDHDKSEIKEEYHAYLKNMIRVVNGHSDLRIKITGHTDAVGTDAYNVGLSERRAESIRKFFSENGLELKKLEIDFKGETQPVDTNKTSEGKRRNRRVDFEFI
ncbi:MAG: OmpA family protein [Bacteroidetes bacterium]|nr:MAG: OmpA family protein [Bacteroidota bacterium]